MGELRRLSQWQIPRFDRQDISPIDLTAFRVASILLLDVRVHASADKLVDFLRGRIHAAYAVFFTA
jgi:hypothetical protein